MTGADWIDDLCSLAVRRRLSLFLLGGSPGAAEGAMSVLAQRHPGVRIVGTASGYNVSPEVIATINRLRPDILLVGMGTPTQEKWIDAHRAELDVPVVWAVGAVFDFVTGRIRRGPGWMTEHGMEWICRLVAEPRKLWRRYLIGNPYFFYRVLRERLLQSGGSQ
jgi:N-acetylglucosaminyldiphosphoundecaprenol N-acetyl-beta-D-mannosaminyltransferase